MTKPRFAQGRSKPAPNFRAMAWAPSYRAPKAQDVLNPPPFVPPTVPQCKLLDDVIAHPEDDAPRRAYADWCESTGDVNRAVFIRRQLQGEFAVPDPAWAVDYEPWCARDLAWRRGFVESLSLSGRCFLTLAATLFRMTPLCEVRLVAIAPYFDELLTCPHLPRLKVLDLRGNDLDDDRIELLRSECVHLAIMN